MTTAMRKRTPSGSNTSHIATIASSLFILLFAYAAASKLIDYQNFHFQLGRSPFISWAAGILAWSVPGIEIAVVFLLLFEKTKLLGLYASVFLMSMFSAYIFFMTHYSYFTPCSCGGILSKMGWATHFYFNLSFLVLGIAAILLYERKETLLRPIYI
jgi:hypothetical protein